MFICCLDLDLSVRYCWVLIVILNRLFCFVSFTTAAIYTVQIFEHREWTADMEVGRSAVWWAEHGKCSGYITGQQQCCLLLNTGWDAQRRPGTILASPNKMLTLENIWAWQSRGQLDDWFTWKVTVKTAYIIYLYVCVWPDCTGCVCIYKKLVN